MQKHASEDNSHFEGRTSFLCADWLQMTCSTLSDMLCVSLGVNERQPVLVMTLLSVSTFETPPRGSWRPVNSTQHTHTHGSTCKLTHTPETSAVDGAPCRRHGGGRRGGGGGWRLSKNQRGWHIVEGDKTERLIKGCRERESSTEWKKKRKTS